MASADFPTALPDASTITSSQTLLAADLADQQDTDRNELRAIATKLGLGASTPVKGKFLGASADGSSAWMRAPGRNRVINGAAQVDQRAATQTADNGYGPDMWRLLIEAASAATLARTTSGLPSSGASASGFLLTIGASNNNKAGFWAPIRSDSLGDLKGDTVNLQLKALASNARIGDVRAAVIQWTGTADNGGAAWADPISSWGSAGTNPTLITNWAYLNMPANLSVPTSWGTDPLKIEGISVGSTMKNLAVLVWIDDKTTTAGDTLIVTDIKLEAGDVCTAIDELPVEPMRTACREYFKRFGGVTNAQIAPGYSNSGTQAVVSMNWDRMYGTTPTLAFGTASTFTIASAAGSPALTNISASAPSPTGATIVATVASGLTAGQGCYMYANATGGTIDVVAPW